MNLQPSKAPPESARFGATEGPPVPFHLKPSIAFSEALAKEKAPPESARFGATEGQISKFHAKACPATAGKNPKSEIQKLLPPPNPLNPP
jgi:hypothetical protein